MKEKREADLCGIRTSMVKIMFAPSELGAAILRLAAFFFCP
jgi:hypothetical protein